MKQKVEPVIFGHNSFGLKNRVFLTCKCYRPILFKVYPYEVKNFSYLQIHDKNIWKLAVKISKFVDFDNYPWLRIT